MKRKDTRHSASFHWRLLSSLTFDTISLPFLFFSTNFVTRLLFDLTHLLSFLDSTNKVAFRFDKSFVFSHFNIQGCFQIQQSFSFFVHHTKVLQDLIISFPFSHVNVHTRLPLEEPVRPWSPQGARFTPQIISLNAKTVIEG